MKKILPFLAVLILLPLMAFAYENFVNPPEDMGAFLTWFFAQLSGISTASASYIIAIVCTFLIGLFKSITPLKPVWDKLGKWKFTIPIILGAIGEVALNFPSPFSWTALIQMFIVGATGAGAVSIALHHIWGSIFTKTT